MKYSKKAAFINRKKEISFLKKWIKEEPEYILFFYGPKSSGKTTLINRFIQEHLDKKEFDVKFLNLRKTFISSYKDFIQAFFGVNISDKDRTQKEIREYNLKVFKLSYEAINCLKQGELDPFSIMKKELEKIKRKGKQPLIIIDELQALQDVYINGQRELIKELFNFFVAMTKESHLCHFLISSSDGYFIERVYNDSKLTKTSELLEVDYLNKEDVFYWLSHLEKESDIENFSLTDRQIEKIWYYFGGSVWEISAFLSKLLRNSENGGVADYILEKEAAREITAYKVRFNDFYAGYHEHRVRLLERANACFEKSGKVVLKDMNPLIKKGLFSSDSLQKELGILVRDNLFSFNPVTGEYKPQGHSAALGLREYCRNVPEF